MKEVILTHKNNINHIAYFGYLLKNIKRITTSTLYFILIFSATTSFGQSADKLFKDANTFYAQKDYIKAKDTYLQVVKKGLVSYELYYNLGNTFFKLDSVASSIYYYEKAKLISTDEELLKNIRLANLKTIDKIEPAPKFFISNWTTRLVSSYSTNVWAIWAIMAMLVSMFLFFVYIKSKKIALKKIAFFTACILFIKSVILLFISFSSEKHNNNLKAVVFENSVEIKSEPNNNSTTLFVIHEGAVAKVLDNVENWRKIKLENNHTGWINEKSIKLLTN
jgi:tetratricopeptide (TPR) repeat protein